MEEDIYRLARQADNILTSEAFQKAMSELEAQTIEQWANGQFKTAQEREEAYGLVRGARTFKNKFVAIIESMKLTKAQAEQREKLSRLHTPDR
jgi:hypothetical protein